MQMQYNKWNELSTSYIFTSALTVATEHRTWLQGFVPLLDTFPKMTIVQAKMEWINARNKNNQRRIKDKTWVLKKSARKKCERVCMWMWMWIRMRNANMYSYLSIVFTINVYCVLCIVECLKVIYTNQSIRFVCAPMSMYSAYMHECQRDTLKTQNTHTLK